jgi:histidinol-phosphate aminotransferase
MFNVKNILRKNISALTTSSSARDELKGKVELFLDMNENAFGSPAGGNFNRYPDPQQSELKEKISQVKGVPAENIFLGNGTDEAIDMLCRAFCNPGKDSVIIAPPTYEMYEMRANINDVFVKRVPLTKNFQLDLESISEITTESTKLIFLCSPNNPTGNSLDREDVEVILNNFEGIVVIDEAYINYSRHRSFISELTEYPNLVVLQTLSKAWGLAGLRIGMVFASAEIIEVFNKIKLAHHISEAAQQLALEALDQIDTINAWTKETVVEREKLAASLRALSFVQHVFPSNTNFLLVKMAEPHLVYDFLAGQGILVRDLSKMILCEGCLRITVGTPEQNSTLIAALQNYRA